MSNKSSNCPNYTGRNLSAFLLIAGLSVTSLRFQSAAAPVEAAAPATSQVLTNSPEILLPYLQLQEQLHGLQLRIEETRQQADAVAVSNAQAVAARLQALEQSLAAQRAKDVDAVTGSNRITLLVASTFGIIGFLAMVLMAYQWRSVSRLAEISASLPPSRLLGAVTSTPALTSGDGQVVVGATEQANTRLLGALDRLEKRIHELEQTGHVASISPALPGNNSQILTLLPAVEGTNVTVTANDNRIPLLVAKGQSLLSLDKADEALACFDEVLATEPSHTDALIKKAAALERLRKLPEAIECYNRAIAADNSLTIAYLYKGGLFNRMERFDEALECYEQALKAQDSRRG
jgi:tetratricopeptide (TPR) repeat protein